MKKKHIILNLILFLIILFIFGCQSSSTKPEYFDSPPKWLNTPGFSQGYYWAVGQSQGDMNPVEGKKEAVADAKGQLARIVESKVTTHIRSILNTVESAKDSFSRRELFREIKINSSARLTNVTIAKTHIQKKADGRFHYYALVKISKTSLEKESKRLQKQFQEKIASVDLNLAEGKKLLKQGFIGSALEKFIQAAINSTRIPEREDRFQDIVLLIQNTLRKIEFKRFNNDQQGTRQKGLPKPVKVKLLYRGTKKTIPIKNTLVKFYLKWNSQSQYDQKGITNSEGIAESKVSKVKLAGKNIRLYVRLDLNKVLEGFDLLLSKKWQAQKAMLEVAVDEAKTIFRFEIKTNFAQEKSVLVVVEKNLQSKISKNPLSEKIILENLKKKGINNLIISNHNQSQDLKIMISALQQENIAKLYYVEISSFTEKKFNRQFVTVKGEIRLIDTKTKELLAKATSIQSITSSSMKQAFERAIKKLSFKLVRNLFNRI